MKKFITKIIIFLVGLVFLDFLVGVGARYLIAHAKGGDTGLNHYICHQMREECLIFGSSRGMHHYDPNIITDSLGLSCWNCSLDGNGIILMYGRYKMLSARYTPKVLIYDVQTSFDLTAGDNHKYLGGLRYDYDEPSIDSIFWSVDKTERFKMMSNCYRYNSQWLQLISDNIHPLQSDNKGYRPMDKKMVYKPKKEKNFTEKKDNHKDNIKNGETGTHQYDSLKLAYLEKLVIACKTQGTKLIFAISPQYDTHQDDIYQPLKDICTKYHVPLINHFCDNDFVNNADYFYDSVHMNRTGATKYTKTIVGELKKHIR